MARREPTQKELSRMSNDKLKSKGYIRVAGFTRKDGTKVKSHIRKLRISEQIEVAITSSEAKAVGEFVLDLTPVGTVKEVKSGAEKVGSGEIATGVAIIAAAIAMSTPLGRGVKKLVKSIPPGTAEKALSVASDVAIKSGKKTIEVLKDARGYLREYLHTKRMAKSGDLRVRGVTDRKSVSKGGSGGWDPKTGDYW